MSATLEVGRTVALTVFGKPTRGQVVEDLTGSLVVSAEGAQFLVATSRVEPIDCPVHGPGCEAWS